MDKYVKTPKGDTYNPQTQVRRALKGKVVETPKDIVDNIIK